MGDIKHNYVTRILHSFLCHKNECKIRVLFYTRFWDTETSGKGNLEVKMHPNTLRNLEFKYAQRNIYTAYHHNDNHERHHCNLQLLSSHNPISMPFHTMTYPQNRGMGPYIVVWRWVLPGGLKSVFEEYDVVINHQQMTFLMRFQISALDEIV